jgi:hypothetical protein
MAWTQTDLTALEKAMGTGLRTVRFENRTIEYQSLAEMQAVRAEMLNEIALASGTPRVRQTRVYTGKGWDC